MLTAAGALGLLFGLIVCTVVAALVVRRDRRKIFAALSTYTPAARAGWSRSAVDAVLADLDRVVSGDRRRIEEFEQSSERLSEALSAMPEGLVICDRSGAVVYRSAAALAFVRARHGEALAEQAIEELLVSALREGAAHRNIDLYGPPRRSLLIRALPLGRQPSYIGAAAIIEDVSERRRLESVRRDFVANVSHELKSPIGALGILAETMQGEDDREVAHRLAGRMQVEAFRVARIIDDLLDLSRIEGDEDPVRERVDVRLVLEQAAERIQPVADHHAITIDVHEPPEPTAVVGDRRQLVSAVHSLLENAVKYSDDGAIVEVRARLDGSDRDEGETVDISVRDFGIGIPAQDLERIFERFYRVDRARARDTGGTGLGLAIVRHVAESHGGQVRVTSAEGEGSTFTLSIPASTTTSGTADLSSPSWPERTSGPHA